MMYRNNPQNNGPWSPQMQEPVNLPKNFSRKQVILIGVGIAVAVLIGLATFGLLSNLFRGEPDNGNMSSDITWSQVDSYLEVVEEEGNGTFASDEDAVEYGTRICSMLEEYYIWEFIGIVEDDHSGILNGVSIQDKVAGLYGAVTVFCPEWYSQVDEWAN